jgi:hypothetical protein
MAALVRMEGSRIFGVVKTCRSNIQSRTQSQSKYKILYTYSSERIIEKSDD